MAKDLKGQIADALTQTRDEIRANMEAKRINASGRTSASLRVDEYPLGVRLVGGSNRTHTIPPGIYASDTALIPTLEVGRKEGGVPRGFYYIIREWTKEKGLSFANESERNTFSYLVARKIADEGSLRYREPSRREDVYSTPVEKAKRTISDLVRRRTDDTIKRALGDASVSTIQTAFA